MIHSLLAFALFLGFQNPTPAPAPAPAPTPAPAPAPAGKIAWSAKDLDAVLKDAKAGNKLVMLFFHSASTPRSVDMSKEAFTDDRVAELLKDVICLQVDQSLTPIAMRYGVQYAPVVVWVNSDGTVRDRLDYHDLATFVSEVTRIKLDLGTVNELRRKVAAKGDDVDARFELYRRLKELGDITASSEQKAAIIKLDPQGTSRASHHFNYDRITEEIERYWAQTGTLHMHKVEELKTFIELESDPELLWDGWMRLANTHAYLANQSASKGMFADAKEHRATRRKCIALSLRGVPQQDPEFYHDWCASNSELFWNERDELSPEDKQFLTTLTTRMLEAFDKDPMAHDLRARAFYLAGQRPQAIDEAQKAVELDPKNADYKARLKLFRGE
ncbi:MAG TPA: thioredoxin family protein [Planctomycetota bacterium]|jgi:tetratricopeptide (TPR) repeat protein|nr:thioredoxin family protein [Planctomycetota bacterium]